MGEFLRQVDEEVGERVLHSLKGQTWYLDESWIPSVLVSDDVPMVERESVARMLAKTARPDHFVPCPVVWA